MSIVSFTCAICGAKFSELEGRKCLQCGKLACRHHFWRAWFKGARGICSVCLSATKSREPDAPEKK
jgi:hypothetical protein